MDIDDAAVVAQVRGGDKDCFRILVERHSRSIFRLGFRMTGNENDAEEVVQEAFMRAFRRLEKFESRSSFGTWVYRIAVNCSLDLIERRKHEPQDLKVHPPAAEEPGTDTSPFRDLASSHPDPERLVYSQELKRRLDKAMATLTPSERAAFVLRHFEERSIEEISKVLNLRGDATKNSIYRAVQKVRKALQPVMETA